MKIALEDSVASIIECAADQSTRYCISSVHLEARDGGSLAVLSVTDDKRLVQMERTTAPLEGHEDGAVLIPRRHWIRAWEVLGGGEHIQVDSQSHDGHVEFSRAGVTLRVPVDVDAKFPDVDAVKPDESDDYLEFGVSPHLLRGLLDVYSKSMRNDGVIVFRVNKMAKKPMVVKSPTKGEFYSVIMPANY